MTTEFRLYEDFDSIPLDPSSWDELVLNSANSSVFCQHAWVSSWWRHYGDQCSLFFVTAETNGKVTAFAPLMLDGKKVLRFIGDLKADYLGLVTPGSDEQLAIGLLKYVYDNRSKWRVAHLRNIPSSAGFSATLSKLGHYTKIITWNCFSISAPYLTIASNDEAIRALLGKHSVRRAERDLAKQGSLRFEVFQTPDEAEPYWQQFAAQHIRRCRHAGRPSTFEDERYLPFLKTLFRECGDYAHFSTVFLDDRPIAFHFGFISQNRLLWYKPSFDVTIRPGSPGIFLIKELILGAQSKGLDELDFTIGAELFKERFTNAQRQVDTFRIHRSRFLFTLDYGYWALRQFVKKLL